MFQRFRGKKQAPTNPPTATAAESQSQDDQEEETNKQGFICPMCMTSLPGPAELQIHFEKVHSEGAEEAKLIDIEDETDALPESSSDDLLSTSSDFSKGHLELSINSNAPDVEKEVLLLKQELAEMSSELKEEKWYTGQLKTELDKVSKERDKFEEEKAMVEEEFSAQLRSAEQGYMQVVEENNKLKEELKFADYNTTKDRHEKLKQQMLAYQNEAEEERQRRQALEDNFKLLQNVYEEEKLQASEVEKQLQARPSSDVVSNLQQEINMLTEQIESIKKLNKDKTEQNHASWKTQADRLNTEVTNFKIAIKELNLEKKGKDEQIASLQTAVSSAAEVSNLSREQTQEKQQQLLDLQHSISDLETAIKEKDDLLANIGKQLNDTKLSLANETNSKEKVQVELHSCKVALDEEKRQTSVHTIHIKELEHNLTKEKEEVNRLEKERIELIAKIEAGEGTDTVIQQFSQEKVKLMEAMTSIEKSMSEQVKQHSMEIDVIRQEKVKISEELQKIQQELSKTGKTLSECQNQLKTTEDSLSNLKNNLKAKNDEYFQLESASLTEKNILNARIDELNRSVQNQESELKATMENLQQARDELKNSDHQQAQQASWIETKNKSIAEMTHKISSLQEQLGLKTGELSTAKMDLESAQKQHSEVKKSKEDMSAKHKQEFETLSAKAIELESEFKRTTAEKKAVMQKLDKIESEKQEVEKNKEELLKQKADLSFELKKLQHEFDESTSKVKQNETNIEELQLHMNQLKEKHMDYEEEKNKELAQLTMQLDDTKKNLESEITTRGKAENEILEWETKYCKLERDLEHKDEVLHEIQCQLEVAEQDLKKPCDSCKNYEIQLCRLQEATKDQNGQIEQLKEQISTLENEVKSKDEEVCRLNQQHKEFCKESEVKENELEASISALAQEKISIQDQLMTVNGEMKELNLLMDGLKTEKEALQNSSSEFEEKVNALKDEKNNFEKEILHLKVDVQTKIEEKEQISKFLKDKEIDFSEEKTKLDEELEKVKNQLTEERESHEKSKDNAQKIQEVLREGSVNLQNKLHKSKEENDQLVQSKDQLEARLNKEIERVRENIRKIEQEVSNRDRRITEYEMKLKRVENENIELKGDITVLEAQIQNSHEEKRVLLDRVLSTEELHKKSKQKLSDTNRRLGQSLSALQELGQENQNMQVQQAIKSNRQWESDTEATGCKKCDKQFALTIRKHHCRNCGMIFCDDCSQFFAVVTSSKKPVRVCEACSNELNNLRGATARRLSTSSTASSQSAR